MEIVLSYFSQLYHTTIFPFDIAFSFPMLYNCFNEELLIMKNTDLKYVCENIGNLSGIPIRLFKDGEQVFYHSVVRLPKDPFLLYKEEIFKITDHVGYFVTPFFNYYGVVNLENTKIVIGPSRQVFILEEDLRKLAFQAGATGDEIDEFVGAMKNIPKMPLMSVLQMLCIINYILNDGEKISLEDIVIYDFEQEGIKNKFETQEAERTLQIAEDAEQFTDVHNTLNIEESLLYIVRKGDTSALKEMMKNAPAVKGGIIAKDQLRQAKNTFIVTTTLVSRAAIRGGMDVEDALSLSDAYIQTGEASKTMEDITNLNYRMVFDYTERVERLHLGKNPSKLASEVTNYVRHHLSETITVEELAKFLYRGRSRLSTDFKKETGENLSDFILKQKIEEAKKLLRYSDKTLAAISFYLGFSSQSHFTRTFKKFTDLTPNDYRDKHKH